MKAVRLAARLAAVAILTLTAMVALGAESGAPAAARRIEVVFVLDTTGSMSGLLQAAKEQIWSIVTRLACARPTPELRLGLVAFRDRDDAYVTRVTDLTGDLDALYADLVALQAGGGGDTAESVNQGLYEAVMRISWSDATDAYRAIFLVGDAPPHMDYADDVKFAESCGLAKRRGIAVNSIQCGLDAATTPVWNEIARLGDGVFSQLGQNDARPVVQTPYDKAIASMARQLDDTRLPYGSEDELAAGARREERAASIYDGSSVVVQAERAGFNVTAAGRRNLYGAKDLLSDVQRGLARVEDVADENLPAALRAMSAEQRRQHLRRQAKVREDLELTIRMFAAKRDDYLAKKGGEERDLTTRLVAAMGPQAKRRGFELGACQTAP